MHHRGGKRIRMDEPPPEFDNAAMTPATDHGGLSVHEPEHFNVAFGAYNPADVANPEFGDQAVAEKDEDSSEEPPPKRVTRSRGRPPVPPPPVIEGVTAPRRRGRPARVKLNQVIDPPYQVFRDRDEDPTLYGAIKSNRESINTIVDKWIESYKTNKEDALVQLMQFFISASGCKGKITPELATVDHVHIIRKMTEKFDEESGEYPLIMSGNQWKKFRSNFCEFIQTLVKMCQYSIIYDQYLMDNIISLLTGLSDSQVRAFRHTATLAVMKLMTALVDVALLGSVNSDNCLRQYEAERLKTKDKRASDRLEVLATRRKELEENMDEIKNMLSYMFKSVFVHRYRDTLPDIRAITMAEIGIWMIKFPAHFLDDLYLKYIGWTLHDKVGEVRLRCLQALQPLYDSEELKGKLELFTSKFKDRIVGMTLDKEYDVAVQAVRLVISILQMHREVLADKDCEHIYELVYSSHRAVAQAAGEFLNVRLFKLEEDATVYRSRRGKKRLPNTPLIRDLVQFFIESELHEHGAYLVDSLIESHDMMKDWECMTDLLIEDPGEGEESLDNKQESSLIELLVCCVKQAASGEAPVGRGAPRRPAPALSRDQLKLVSDDRHRLTRHFIQTLPVLLEKFVADPEKLANLLQIPQYFDLDVYVGSRQEANLSALLDKIKDIVSKRTETEVLETCGKTLEVLCTEGKSIYRTCDTARSIIINMVVDRYDEVIHDWRSNERSGEPDADDVFSLTSSLKKLSIMYQCHNLNNNSIWESLFDDLPKCKVATVYPEEALLCTIKSCFYYIFWGLDDLEDKFASGMNITEELNNLRSKQRSFVDECKDIMINGITHSMKAEAYKCFCDLLLIFCERLPHHNKNDPKFKELVLEPLEQECDLLNNFVQEFVFVLHQNDNLYSTDIQDERRIEELHKRRNFLASFCKLIVYNIVPVRWAADIFKHYVKCSFDYGDIIKTTLSKAKEFHKLNCTLTMALSMQILFLEAQPNKNTDEFLEIKELAKRFALSFGLDFLKNREAITALHRSGIVFAVQESGGVSTRVESATPPPNLLFLEILCEFTNKLIRQDKKVVLQFLESRLPEARQGGQGQGGEEWQPLALYRSSLKEAGDAGEAHLRQANRVYGRRKKKEVPDEDDDDNDSDQDAVY